MNRAERGQMSGFFLSLSGMTHQIDPTPPKRVRGTFVLALVMVCSMCAGCRLWEYEFAWTQLHPDQQPQSAATWVTDEIAQQLNADAWNLNRQWSPITEPGSPLQNLRYASAGARWTFHPATSAGAPALTLEEIVAGGLDEEGLPNTPEEDLHSAVERGIIEQLTLIAERDDLAGWNAAILLTHYDAVAARPFVPVLARLVGDPPQIAVTVNEKSPDGEKPSRNVSDDLRAASAEAWLRVLATAEFDGEQAMAVPGHVLQDAGRSRDARRFLKADLPISVEAELIRGIGRRVAPSRLPDVANWLNRPLSHAGTPSVGDLRRAELHRAAIDACQLYALHLQSRSQPIDLRDTEIWPQTLWNCVDDPDPHIRSGYGRLLAIANDAGAFDALTNQITDTNREVQETALQTLGLLKTDQARARLREYMTRKSLLRKTALQGLAAFGDRELIRYVDDEDARVREELARQLSNFPGSIAQPALAKLITDRVAFVQTAAVEAITFWPNEWSLPLLLHGAVEGAYQTRNDCLTLFAQRSGSVVQPFQARTEIAARRQNAMQVAVEQEIAYPLILRPADHTPDALEPGDDSERIAEIKHRLNLAVNLGRTAGGFEEEWFRNLPPEDLPALEKVYHESEPAYQDYLLQKVLPPLSPEFAALQRLELNDVDQRRKAAGELRQIGQSRTLSAIVLERLSDLMVREQDAVVWRDVIAAVQHDTSDSVVRIIQLAVNHHWSDVRIRGCQYVIEHGRPEFAPWMQRLFQDPNPAVQLLAIRAAGRCGDRSVITAMSGGESQSEMIGLEGLMRSFSGERHLAVVESMARLLDPRGLDELNRLSYSEDWRTRRAAIEVMAETGQTRFLDRLINILWLDGESRPEVEIAALAAIEKMIPLIEHPAELAQAPTRQEKAAIWHRWWEQRTGKTAGGFPSTAESRYNQPAELTTPSQGTTQ